MSEPKRYNVEELNCCFDAEMVEHPTGEYVEYSDYARLKSEVERLTKLCQATSPDGFIHIRDINAAKAGKQPE